MKNAITSKINPFKKDIYKSKLFNIRTGFMATEETEKYLLSILDGGKVKRNSFINECTEDKTRFSKPIKKTKIVNFAISNFQKKNKSQKVSKIASTRVTRDIFGRLLCLAVTNRINFEKIFEYPIHPQPPYFTHPDGTVRSTDKAAIHHYMVKDQNFQSPNNVETITIDAMFLLKSSLSKLPGTLSAIAKLILQNVLSLTKHRADLCFDR